MALTDDNGGGFNVSMPVAPAYGGNMGGGFGFGGDWAWILLLLVLGGGWGGFGGFGMGGMMGAGMWGMMDGFGLYPWLNNSQNINDGFRDQQLATQIEGIRGGVTGLSQQLCQCCGDMRYDMANGFNGVNNSIFGAQTAISQQMNANEIASLNRSFAEQTANAQGFNGVQAGIADTRYTIASEACNTRSASAMNTRDIIDSQTRGTQAILDKLCQLELDGYKRENDQLRTENSTLKNQSFVANEINQQNEVFYNRLKNCPVNAVPVAGNTPLFSCNPGFNTPGCGCGCGA